MRSLISVTSLFPDGELDVVYRLQKFKQNSRHLYCSYQLDSNFQLFIFCWLDLKNLLTVAAIHFFNVTNWLYTTRQSDEGVQTSHWCLACFFNRQLVNWGRDRLTMLTMLTNCSQHHQHHDIVIWDSSNLSLEVYIEEAKDAGCCRSADSHSEVIGLAIKRYIQSLSGVREQSTMSEGPGSPTQG